MTAHGTDAIRPAARLGLWSGVGLVVANMIGAGVFISTGFMAQEMGPGPILLAWATGMALALCGATAYAAVARAVPRSGGEYRYLSELLHPSLGYLAGWASLLVGFSAPIAVSAVAAGSFLATLLPVEPRSFGAALIVALTVAHAVGLRPSATTQNALVGIKALLLLGFTAVGLAAVPSFSPSWTAPQAPAAGALATFATSLFYIAFAFSGWNATAYAAEEFARPERDVPRAMLLGCALVGTLYLLLNFVFVASLTPERATVVFDYEARRVTLGHLVMQDAAGPLGGAAMSILATVAFASSISAMTFVGPRVYAAMARDGFLPRVLAGREGEPPAASIVLQGVLALVLLYTHRVQEVLGNVGAILTLFAALTATGVFRVRRLRPSLPAPGPLTLAAAAVYALSAAGMLYLGFRNSLPLVGWVLVVSVAGLAAYRLSARRLPPPAAGA